MRSNNEDNDSVRDPRTYAIIGAAMEVHRQLGRGFLEAVYFEALTVEFNSCSIPFRREVPIAVAYKSTLLPVSYRADFICYDEIIVEIKSISQITNIEQAQLINYLKATRHPIGLLINFGADSLEWKRFAHSFV